MTSSEGTLCLISLKEILAQQAEGPGLALNSAGFPGMQGKPHIQRLMVAKAEEKPGPAQNARGVGLQVIHPPERPCDPDKATGQSPA